MREKTAGIIFVQNEDNQESEYVNANSSGDLSPTARFVHGFSPIKLASDSMKYVDDSGQNRRPSQGKYSL